MGFGMIVQIVVTYAVLVLSYSALTLVSRVEPEDMAKSLVSTKNARRFLLLMAFVYTIMVIIACVWK